MSAQSLQREVTLTNPPENDMFSIPLWRRRLDTQQVRYPYREGTRYISILIIIFLLKLVNRKIRPNFFGRIVLLYKPNYLDSLIAACAAARRAIGTRKGEQDT